MRTIALVSLVILWCARSVPGAERTLIRVEEDAEQLRIETPALSAVVRKTGYVSGVAGGSFVDKRSGFRDAGFGLDIVDWLMEPGSDEAYRGELPRELVYEFNNAFHGARAKRSIEGPQICTQAQRLELQVIRGKDFLAVQMSFRYHTAAPGYRTGSTWTQTLVFPARERFFLSSDRIESVNNSDAMFLRIDMPGHIKHQHGDTFSQVYLSYAAQTNSPQEFQDGRLSAAAFDGDFPPDAQFNYQRERAAELPSRFIRAYQLRDRATGAAGPWLAGMTLEPAIVTEAWCHQRGYVCMIEEFGGRPIRAGESFSAAFVVGFFDSLDDMHRVYDRYRGHTGIVATEQGWQLTR